MQNAGERHQSHRNRQDGGSGGRRSGGGDRNRGRFHPESSWERTVQQHFGSDYVQTILFSEDANALIDKIRAFASDGLYAMDIAHFRNLIGYIQKTPSGSLAEVRWMAASIAGRGGRDREGDQLRTLAFLIDRLAQKVATDKDARPRLQQFIEIVVAYHRFYHAK